MKKLLLILILIPTLFFGQSLKELIKEYEDYCNEIVTDTIYQNGIITETLKEVEGGLYQIKLDTVWESPNCPEYKDGLISLSYYNIGGSIDLKYQYPEGVIVDSETSKDRTRPVERKYACKCRRRMITPFSEHFWNWIKNN
ncbi:MAG: hypothetical protein ACPGTO_10280 [Polaribacter sp.]